MSDNERIDEYHGEDKRVIELADSPEPVRKRDPDEDVLPVEGYRTPKKVSREKVQTHFATTKFNTKFWNNVASRGGRVQKKGKHIVIIV